MSQKLSVRIHPISTLCIRTSLSLSLPHAETNVLLRFFFSLSKKSFEFMYAQSLTVGAFMSQMHVKPPASQVAMASQIYISLRLHGWWHDSDGEWKRTVGLALLSYRERVVTDRLTTYPWLDKQGNVRILFLCNKSLIVAVLTWCSWWRLLILCNSHVFHYNAQLLGPLRWDFVPTFTVTTDHPASFDVPAWRYFLFSRGYTSGFDEYLHMPSRSSEINPL